MEQVTGLLADGLVRRGVDVTLFATLDSQTAATLDGVSPRGYEEDDSLDGRVWEGLHVAHALSRSAEFDLMHNHLDWLPLAFAKHCRTRLLDYSRFLRSQDPSGLSSGRFGVRLDL